MPAHVKRRDPPVPGTIPAELDMFRSEVRFYREIAPVVGVRVPACQRAEAEDWGTLLELEDLSAWTEGADPVAAASVLAELHRRWVGQAPTRWPWLRPVGAGADLVEALLRVTWPTLAARADVTPAVRAAGERLTGRVTEVSRAAAGAGPTTLVHGDASLRNMRTGPDGEVALLDWEDVSAGPGILDLAWLLVSSTDPSRWAEVTAAYGTDQGLRDVLPALVVQALLSLADSAVGSAEAGDWIARIEAAARHLRAAKT
jgi:Ser/Thr protein kinase RdoA (MazF antagonist)